MVFKMIYILESKLTTNSGDLVDNPFYVPDDYEVTYSKLCIYRSSS